MKKTRFTICFIVMALCGYTLNAQTPILTNGDFEEWSDNMPEGWKTISIPMLGISSSVAKTEDSQSGLYAVELETKEHQFMGEDIILPGILTNADVNLMALFQVLEEMEQMDSMDMLQILDMITPYITGGTPITGTPVSFDGYYKYAPSEGSDQCFIMALFFGNDATGKRTAAGIAMHVDSVASDVYKAFSVPYMLIPSEETITPNEVVVAFMSSFSMDDQGGPLRGGSRLQVDNVSLTISPVGLSDTGNDEVKSIVYPNPSDGTIRITGCEGKNTSVQVTDLEGRIVLEKENYNGEAMNLPVSGNYLIQVIQNRNSTVHKVTVK